MVSSQVVPVGGGGGVVSSPMVPVGGGRVVSSPDDFFDES